MRMRKKKNGAARLEALDRYMIHPTENSPVSAAEIFGNSAPLHLEIGCGKGDFVLGMAQKHPDWNFIAVERVPDVILAAMEKIRDAELTNVRFCNINAADLEYLFVKESVDVIYLNFSDPWPKAGHAKRRLTHTLFLNRYRTLLAPNGHIEMKTDNRGLFDFTLEQMEIAEYKMEDITYDLHNSIYNEGNIQTEYERNFSAKGFPIHRVVAYPLPASNQSSSL